MSLPPFPVDDATLDLLDAALNPRLHGDPDAETSHVEALLAFLSQMGGSDPDAVEEEIDDDVPIHVLRDQQYHVHNVVEALIREVRRLRGLAGR